MQGLERGAAGEDAGPVVLPQQRAAGRSRGSGGLGHELGECPEHGARIGGLLVLVVVRDDSQPATLGARVPLGEDEVTARRREEQRRLGNGRPARGVLLDEILQGTAALRAVPDGTVGGRHVVSQDQGAIAGDPREHQALGVELVRHRRAAVDRLIGERLRGARNPGEPQPRQAHGGQHHRQLGIVAEVVGQPGHWGHEGMQPDRLQPPAAHQVVPDEHLAVTHQVVRRGDAPAHQHEPVWPRREQRGQGVRVGGQERLQVADLGQGVAEGWFGAQQLADTAEDGIDRARVTIRAGRADLEVLGERVVPIPVQVTGRAHQHLSGAIGCGQSSQLSSSCRLPKGDAQTTLAAYAGRKQCTC